MKKKGQEFKKRDPNFMNLDNVPELSEITVNTERVKTQDKGMQHKEGGWPLNVDPTETNETLRHRKKLEKD
jgi:dynein intermediate chain 2